MKNLHKKQLRLSRRGFWLVCALLVCLRLALTSFQQAYTWVGGAPLDDELMFRAAQNITAGEWLGAYDYLTLSCRIWSRARRSGAARRCWQRLHFRRCGAENSLSRAVC